MHTCTSQTTLTEGSTLANSSIVMMAEVNEQLEPSYSDSISTPINWERRMKCRTKMWPSISRIAQKRELHSMKLKTKNPYTLLKQSFQHSFIEMLSFIHLQNLGLDDVLSEARHFLKCKWHYWDWNSRDKRSGKTSFIPASLSISSSSVKVWREVGALRAIMELENALIGRREGHRSS